MCIFFCIGCKIALESRFSYIIIIIFLIISDYYLKMHELNYRLVCLFVSNSVKYSVLQLHNDPTMPFSGALSYGLNCITSQPFTPIFVFSFLIMKICIDYSLAYYILFCFGACQSYCTKTLILHLFWSCRLHHCH